MLKRIKHFHIQKPLSQGVMSSTYLAQDIRSDILVVLKMAQEEHAGAAVRLRREARFLAGLEHPGIVKILDRGHQAGCPWYVIEYIPCGDLTTWLKHQRYGMGAVSDVLPIVVKICESLAYLHARGIVHGDLKPSNILFRASGQPVLVDFGLATRFGDREVLEADAGICASPAYAAPEQLQGELLDARADLYALGCLIFELLTGTTPFLGDVDELILQHLSKVAPLLSERVAGLSKELDCLVSRLLAKERRSRLGYAQDVIAALCPKSSIEDFVPHLYRPDFVGRDDIMGELLAQARAVQDQNKGGIVVLRGESGVGKTRVVLEAARTMTALGFTVVPGICTLEDGPFDGVRPVLQMIADVCQRDALLKQKLGFRLSMLTPFEPALEGLYETTITEVDESARKHLIKETCYVFCSLAKQKGALVFALDDVQWADEMTSALLMALCDCEFLLNTPLFLILNARTEEPTSTVQSLLAKSNVSVIDLPRLAEVNLHRLLCDHLGAETVPQKIVSFLNRVSEGNPFYIWQYLQTAIELGILKRTSQEGWVLSSTD